LAREGANLVVNARSNREEAAEVAEEIRALGVKALPLLADIGDRAQLEPMLEQALAEFGGIDIVVNNASRRPQQPFVDMSYDEWRDILAMNLDAAFFCAKAALPGMLERGWGRIINITGEMSYIGRPGWAHVGASKMGVLGFARSLSKELAPQGVLVNCVSPGLIDTSRDSGTPMPPGRAQNIPVGRLGYSDDIASLCVFLCTEAAGFISGQTFHVNGGERSF
ncbi:MAG: SDR family NAD(P)-dependent oxidoreductase, partial [Dehalococcoidia bacterium]